MSKKKPAADKKAKSDSTPENKKRRGPNGKKACRSKLPGRQVVHAKEATATHESRAFLSPLQVVNEHEEVVETEPAVIEPYDDSLLDVCRTRWQLADWEALVQIEGQTLYNHPQRGKIALLVATALFQLGRNQEAQRLLQSALDWGASSRQAVQMLMSGTYYSLAEARTLLDHIEDARAHHLAAVRTGGVPGDDELIARVRIMKNSLGK